jgi:hypothetical protein
MNRTAGGAVGLGMAARRKGGIPKSDHVMYQEPYD